MSRVKLKRLRGESAQVGRGAEKGAGKGTQTGGGVSMGDFSGKSGLSLNTADRKFDRYARFAMVGLFAMVATFLASSILTPVSNSSAEQQVLASISEGNYSVSVSGSGTVNLNLGQPSTAGKIVKATDALSI